jgi:hypothetical protein
VRLEQLAADEQPVLQEQDRNQTVLEQMPTKFRSAASPAL